MAPPKKYVGVVCGYEPCPKPARVVGLCHTHYNQHRHGRQLCMTKPRHARAARDEAGNKWCSRCTTFQPEAQFTNCTSAPDGLHSWCRTCLAQNDRYRRYGLTKELFAEMLASQGGVCAVCGTDTPGTKGWCLDHDHACCESDWTCGRCNRGVLCGSCNKGLGHFFDSPDVLRAAATYLERLSIEPERMSIVRGV